MQGDVCFNTEVVKHFWTNIDIKLISRKTLKLRDLFHPEAAIRTFQSGSKD